MLIIYTNKTNKKSRKTDEKTVNYKNKKNLATDHSLI